MTEYRCPDHGKIDGLGVCWKDGCGYDAREPKAQTATATESLSEEQIQSQVKDYLAALGCDVVDTSQGFRPDGSSRITAGLSDLIVFADGRMVFAELKAGKNTQTESQKRFESWCERAGARYEVWRSVEDAEAWYEEQAA